MVTSTVALLAQKSNSPMLPSTQDRVPPPAPRSSLILQYPEVTSSSKTKLWHIVFLFPVRNLAEWTWTDRHNAGVYYTAAVEDQTGSDGS
jgi:hypothetical protein